MIDLTKLSNPTPAEAARFLNQATWGFNSTDLAYLVANGYNAWFDRQFKVPYEEAPGHYNWVMTHYPPDRTGANDLFLHFTQSVVRRAAQSRDLLRQKLTFALSQILVTSGQADPYHAFRHISMASYYDLLGLNAFGKYEDLLVKVSKSIVMANYLTFLGSRKEDGVSRPDENYARELQQLFTIGVDLLDPVTGQPVPDPTKPGSNVEAYSIGHIRSIAKVFTGFYVDNGQFQFPSGYGPYDSTGQQSPNFGQVNFNANDHDGTPFTLLYPTASGGAVQKNVFYRVDVPQYTNDPDAGPKRVEDCVRGLAKHPNVAFFVARQLIQRFVTSNPSQSYVTNVARVHQQTNGDLSQVVKAVLMDESLFVEGRRTGGAGPDFGRIREPFARLTQWARLFSAQSVSGKWWLGDHPVSPHHPTQFGQSPLMAKSVFNFYRPSYVYPTGIETTKPAPSPMDVWGGKRVAPELQLVNEYTSQSYLGAIYQVLDANQGVGGGKDTLSAYSAWTPKASNPALLVAELNLMLAAGRVNATAIKQIVQAVSAMANSTEVDRRNRVQAAAFLLMIAPEYIVQK